MSVLRSHAPALRSIGDHMGLESAAAIAKHPGVVAVYRITVHYFDGRAHDSVTTLKRMTTGEPSLETVYLRAFQHKALTHPITLERVEAFAVALSEVKFDRMGDQANLPEYASTDLWFIERAAGMFSHGVVIAPATAEGDYGRLVNAVKNGLPEAIKQVGM